MPEVQAPVELLVIRGYPYQISTFDHDIYLFIFGNYFYVRI